MKICEKVMSYAFGEMDAAEEKVFKEHLVGCDACQKEVRFLQLQKEALLPSAAPAEIVENLFAKTTRKKSFFAGLKPALLSTACLCMGVFVFWVGLSPDRAAFDAGEVVAYMSENLDEEYLSFAEELSAFEEEF